MQCHDCGLDNRTGARFCEECGARLDPACPACGATGPPDRRFCGNCGEPLGGSPLPAAALGPTPDTYTPRHLARQILSLRDGLVGERKQVTVLFADMRGSLELLGGRDPEEAQALLDPILTIMMDAVHRYEGTVNQMLGDGIMALFGAPLAHEDHAVRACHAALDMQEAVVRHAATLAHAGRGELRIRVGLNSGEVVVRAIGNDLHMDYTAIGQTTHLAARMEQLAAAGATFLTAATRRLAEGYVEVQPLGPTAIKGLASPIEVYQLVGRGLVRTRLEASRARARTAFVGRRAELSALGRAAASAAAGHGRVVAVVGEPGVGKSRLVAEFTASHLSAGWHLVETGTVSYARGAESLAVVDLLRSHLRIGAEDDRALIEEKVSSALQDIAHPHPVDRTALLALLAPSADDADWQGLDPSERRQYTLDAVSRVLLHRCRTRPLCLLVEDLHWADADTRSLLDSLVDLVPTARMLVLVTYRPEHRHGWSTRDWYAELPIEPLARDEAEGLLDDLLGREPTLGPVKALLVDRTEGNPFFLEECVRDLVEKGVLTGRRGAYQRAGATGSVEVPASVHSVLAARIDRLPPAEKLVLQAAAVIGKDVPLAVLEAAVAPDVVGVDALPELQAAEFLYEVRGAPARTYTFKHVLTRDVAYGGLVADRRRIFDARILTALERLHPVPTGEQVERIALHAFRGEVWPEALRYCREAGARAYARSAHRPAVEYFEQALTALGHLPRTDATVAEAIDLRLDLRYALMPLGELPRVFEHLSGAGALARSAGDRRRLGLVSAFLTNYHHLMGDVDRAVECGEEALAIAGEVSDTQTEILANAYLGLTYYVLGRYRPAIAIAERNVALLVGPRARERFGSASLPAVYSRTCLAWSLGELGEFAEGARVAAEGLEIAEDARHSFSLVYACLGLGTLLLRKGALDGATPWLERAFSICHEAGIPLLTSLVAPPLTSAYVLAGRGADAVAMLERAGEQAASISDPVERRAAPGAWAEAYLATGRAADALPLAERNLAERRRLKARGFEAWALRQLAEVLARQDPPRWELAEAHYLDALHLATALGMRPLEGVCRLGLASLHEAMGKRQDARADRTGAEDIFESLDMPYWLAQARMGLARPQ